MDISMNACRISMHGVNDKTTLIFHDENGNEIDITISLDQSKRLMEGLYEWTLVKHKDRKFIEKHYKEVIETFSEALNSSIF